MSTTANTNPFNAQSLFAALAELVGTFFLTFVALTVAAPVTPYAVGLTLLVFVYAIGGLSGCHINPAVTIGLVASRRFPLLEGIIYIVLQIVGALLARFVAGLGVVGKLAHRSEEHKSELQSRQYPVCPLLL